MRLDERRPVFLHIHVPKCGGTSFNEVLWRNFRRKLLMEYGRYNMLRPTADQVEWSVWRHHWYDAVAGHRFHTRLNYEGRDHRLIAITFVRDPVEHFTSAYNFMRRVEYPEIENLSIAEVAEWVLGGKHRDEVLLPWFVHSQLEHLDSEQDLARIERLIDTGSLHVFPIEKFADACLLLRKKYPEHFPHTAFRVKNMSPRVQAADTRVVELLQQYRQQDFTLCELATRRFEQQLAQHFTGDELAAARRQQRRRCRFLGSPLGEAGYIAGRITDLTLQYMERRRWIGPGRTKTPRQ